MAFKKEFSDQIPRYQPWTLERVIVLLGSIAGLAAIAITFFKLDRLQDDQQTMIFVVELSILCLGLIAYLYVTSRKKLHRYAQAVFHMHYINHLVRDQIAALQPGQTVDPSHVLKDIVNATSSCFSILIARRCRACIQTIDRDYNVTTFVRDSITSTQSAINATHKIEENTDYDNIWYGKNGCPRFFLSRDLVKLWRNGRYRNTSFAVLGDPQTVNFFGATIVRKWPLPYKSTIVWPIRYIPEGCNWPAFNRTALSAIPPNKRPTVWGFLCIDCGSRNAFDSVYSPELGAAIADAIFTLLHATRASMAGNLPFPQNRGTLS